MRVLICSIILAGAACVRRVPPPETPPPSPALPLAQLLALETPQRVPPAFPPACQRRGRIAFMAVGRLTTLDVSAVAERYRRVYGVAVEVLPPLSSAAGRRTACWRRR